jgi:hypothetical protein
MIDNDKRNFIGEQQRKINELHNYLDDKLRCIIAEYDKAIASDVSEVKNNLDRIEEKAHENKIFITEIQTMRQLFSKQVIRNFMDKVSKTANMFNYYNYLKTLDSAEDYNVTYPNHTNEHYPYFDVDTNKEIEILANKFRVMSTPGMGEQKPSSPEVMLNYRSGNEMPEQIDHPVFNDVKDIPIRKDEDMEEAKTQTMSPMIYSPGTTQSGK